MGGRGGDVGGCVFDRNEPFDVKQLVKWSVRCSCFSRRLLTSLPARPSGCGLDVRRRTQGKRPRRSLDTKTAARTVPWRLRQGLWTHLARALSPWAPHQEIRLSAQPPLQFSLSPHRVAPFLRGFPFSQFPYIIASRKKYKFLTGVHSYFTFYKTQLTFAVWWPLLKSRKHFEISFPKSGNLTKYRKTQTLLKEQLVEFFKATDALEWNVMRAW